MKQIILIVGGLSIIILHDFSLISLTEKVLEIKDYEDVLDSTKKAAVIAGVTALLLDMVLFGAFIVLALS
jgi:hypothetical protein